jgi:hypothetical protein
LAFCAKAVFGRLTVFLSSNGACVDIKGHVLLEISIVAQPNGKTKLRKKSPGLSTPSRRIVRARYIAVKTFRVSADEHLLLRV